MSWSLIPFLEELFLQSEFYKHFYNNNKNKLHTDVNFALLLPHIFKRSSKAKLINDKHMHKMSSEVQKSWCFLRFRDLNMMS